MESNKLKSSRKYRFPIRTCTHSDCNVNFRPLKENQFRCCKKCMMETSSCIRCNCEFEHHYNKKRDFCSRKCAGLQSRDRVEISCLNCNVIFQVRIGAKETSKYCSRKCKDEYQCILFSGAGNPNFGKHSLLGRKHTEEQNERCRQKVKESWKTEERRKKHNIWRENYKLEFGYYPFNSPNSYLKGAETRIRKYKEGTLYPNTHGLNGFYTSTKTGITEYYHSSWEKIRMIELDNDDTVIFWTKRHGIHIKITEKSNYLPDFLIHYSSGTKILEEVKGYVRDENLFLLQQQKAFDYIEYNDNGVAKYIVNYMNHLRNGKNKN